METLLLFFLFCVGGSVIQSVTGFGFSIFCMTVFPFLIGNYHAATAISGMCGATMGICIAWRHRRDINVRLVVPLSVSYFIAFPLGVKLTLILDEDMLLRVLGGILICLSLYFFFLSDRISLRPTIVGGLCCGFLGGLFSGFCSIGGPPVVLYLLAAAKTKEEYRASIQFYFSVGNSYGVLVRAFNGLITTQVLGLWILALFALLIGGTIGGKIFNRVNAAVLRRMVYAIMAISGCTMLF